MAEKTYQRLTRTRLRQVGFFTAFATRSSLWLGQDHLLCVDASFYTEDYKRFYFRDIQALTLQLTHRRRTWNWVLGALTGLCLALWSYALIATVNSDAIIVTVIVGAIFTLLFGVPLAVNNFLGPTCACELRTAVQTESLPSIARVRQARKILERIRPLIVTVQGPLPPEEIPARLLELSQTPARPAAAPSPARAPGTEPPARYVIDDLNAPPRILP